jgi:hypothetical protein
VLDIGKPFGTQQFIGYILRRDADAGVFDKADGLSFPVQAPGRMPAGRRRGRLLRPTTASQASDADPVASAWPFSVFSVEPSLCLDDFARARKER